LCICVVPTIISPLGYMYVVGRQVNSMAKSGLLPAIFKQTVGETRTPIMGMLLVMALGLMGLFYAWAMNPYTTTSRFSSLAGCLVYFAMFTCYIIFNTRFSNLERSFRNPLGITSAVIGMIIFAAILIVMIFLNPEYYQVTVLFVGYLLIMTMYYYAYAETQQFFSASEQKVFFKAYIVNMKRRKKHSFMHRMWSDFWKACNISGFKSNKRSKEYASSANFFRSDSNSKLSDYSDDHNSSSLFNHFYHNPADRVNATATLHAHALNHGDGFLLSSKRIATTVLAPAAGNSNDVSSPSSPSSLQQQQATKDAAIHHFHQLYDIEATQPQHQQEVMVDKEDIIDSSDEDDEDDAENDNDNEYQQQYQTPEVTVNATISSTAASYMMNNELLSSETNNNTTTVGIEKEQQTFV